MIFVEILHYFGWFFATRIRFIEADPQHWLFVLIFLDFGWFFAARPVSRIRITALIPMKWDWTINIYSGTEPLRLIVGLNH